MVQRKRAHGLQKNAEGASNTGPSTRGMYNPSSGSETRKKQVKSDRRHKHDGMEEEVDDAYAIPVQEGSQWVRGDDCAFRSVTAPSLADFVTHKFDQKEWVNVPATKAMKDCKTELEADGSWVVL